MRDSSGTLDDLKTLEREAAELQKIRQQNDRKLADQAAKQEQDDAAEKVAQNSIPRETDQPEDGAPDLANQLEMYIKEIEGAAQERPRLALLTTFVLGVIMGSLLTRK